MAAMARWTVVGERMGKRMGTWTGTCRAVALGAAMIALMAGCSDDSDASQSNTSQPNNISTSASAGSNPEAEPGPVCAEAGPQGQLCDGQCVDVRQNMAHCGTCTNACDASTQYCGDGDCLCRRSRDTNCGSQCVDTRNNPHHCGGCNVACGTTQYCDSGTCRDISDNPFVVEVVRHTNEARRAGQDCGVHGRFAPTFDLSPDEFLNQAAQAHSDDMAANRFMEHTGSDGSDFVQRIRRTDFAGSPVGENVAMGQDSGREVVAAWVDSDGHCSNLMNPDAKLMGVGYKKGGDGRPYWTQLFGR